MMMKTLTILTVSAISIASFSPAYAPAYAMSEEEYIAALKIAQQKIERERAANAAHANGGNALSSSLLMKLMGRYYKVGDQWEVAAWTFDNPAMRRTNDPAHLQRKPKRGGVFRYEVVNVKNGADPQVTIHVTQQSAHGMKPVDSKVQKLVLNMNDKMMQSQKSYEIQGRVTQVSPFGVRSTLTPLELFPLDVPELQTAIQQAPQAMPELPEQLSQFARTASIKPNLSQSLWFEQDDFFGRPIQALWERGNPWPTYFRTTHGIALLISSNTKE